MTPLRDRFCVIWADLPGPSRTIIVEPLEAPAPSIPTPAPEREPEPVTAPEPDREKVPA